MLKHRSEVPNSAITVFSQNPPETSRRFGVHAVSRWRPWAWIPSLLKTNKFLLGGGGLLQETTGPWNYIYYLSLIVIAKVCGCQTETVAIGVDPTKSVLNRFLTRIVLNHFVDTLTVRDEVSRKALTDCGVSRSIEICRDPVFDLTVLPSTLPSSGIAFALSRLKERPHWAKEVAELCDRLHSQLLVPIDLLVLFPDQDSALAQEILKQSSGVRAVRQWERPAELLSWIPQYELVIGTRFHALVLASMGKIPFIGWGHQKKVLSLCQMTSSPAWNPDEGWSLERQFDQILAFYQTKCKSVILETRMS